MHVPVVIRKIHRNLNDFGFRGVLTKGIQYVLKWVYVNRKYRIYRRDLGDDEYQVNVPEGLVLKNLSSDDCDAIKQIEGMEEWLHGKLSEIISHGLCVAAIDGSQVVGFNLIAFNEVFITLLNLKKHLRPHHAWSEQISVMKAYRKKGLASALRYRVFADLQKRGIRTLYGGALVSNIPSLKAAEKVGFRIIADVNYRKLLNREQRTWKRIRHAAH